MAIGFNQALGTMAAAGKEGGYETPAVPVGLLTSVMTNVQSNFSGMSPGSFAVHSNLPPQYVQFGRFSGSKPIPLMGAQIRPVIATATGEAPRNRWDRRGAPTGITYQNLPDIPQGDTNSMRLKLYGRLGSTPSHTLLLHPELNKTLPGGNPSLNKYDRVSRGYSLINTRARPGQGTAEGVRYTDELRKEVGGAQLHFNPTSGRWQTRASMRPVNYQQGAEYLINRTMSKLRMGGPEFTGYSTDNAWQNRLKSGTAVESKTERNVGPTIETYEHGKQPLGGLAQQLKM